MHNLYQLSKPSTPPHSTAQFSAAFNEAPGFFFVFFFFSTTHGLHLYKSANIYNPPITFLNFDHETISETNIPCISSFWQPFLSFIYFYRSIFFFFASTVRYIFVTNPCRVL